MRISGVSLVSISVTMAMRISFFRRAGLWWCRWMCSTQRFRFEGAITQSGAGYRPTTLVPYEIALSIAAVTWPMVEILFVIVVIWSLMAFSSLFTVVS